MATNKSHLQPGLKVLRSICIIAASLGSVIPGFAFFEGHAPPLLPATVTLITALAAGGVLTALTWPHKSIPGPKALPRALGKAGAICLGGFLLAVAYIAAYFLTTVAPPPEVVQDSRRCQAGFGLSFLTASAQQFVDRTGGDLTSHDLMMAFGAYPNCETGLIWRTWSILSCGIGLILLFAGSSLIWSFGFARLARLLRPPRVLVLVLAAFALSCAAPRFSTKHPTTQERIDRLKAKTEELDIRSAPPLTNNPSE